MTGTQAMPAGDVAGFLFEEAQLLDDHLLDDWLALMDPQIRYLMPSTSIMPPPSTAEDRVTRDRARWGTSTGPEEKLRFWLYDEDCTSLNMRVRRLDSGMAHSELPESITNHLVSNVTVAPDPDEADVLRVRSRFVVHQVRHESNESVFFGARWDRIRQTDSGLRLLRRYIELGHPLLPRTISVFF